MSLDRGFRPGAYRDLTKGLRSPKPHEDYPFSKRVNRLKHIDQIKGLIENIEESVKGSIKDYTGKIEGIEVRITFSSNHASALYTKSEEDLAKSYKKVLDVLLGR